jgi:hypothetical protein
MSLIEDTILTGVSKRRCYSQSINFYSKPVMSVNWDWKISEKSKLSTVGYASFGRGGGTGVIGSIVGNRTSGTGAATNSKV